MTTMDVLILLGGALLLAMIAGLLLEWRRTAIQDVVRGDDPAGPDRRISRVRGDLLWLLEQRGARSPGAGVEPPPEVVAQARSLLRRGKKIEAVKLIREHSDRGLKESKDFIDSLD